MLAHGPKGNGTVSWEQYGSRCQSSGGGMVGFYKARLATPKETREPDRRNAAKAFRVVADSPIEENRPGSYQGNTLWWLGSAADGHHAQRRYTIHETQTTDRTDGTDKEDHRTILFQVRLASLNQFRPQSPTSLIRVFGVIRGYFLANLAHQAKERRSDTLLPSTSQN